MRKFIIAILVSLLYLTAAAQSTFDNNILQGDVKMKEQLYEMALNYYKKAEASATTAKETILVRQKISACTAAIDASKPKPEKKQQPSRQTASSTSSNILFSDQYLETGDLIDSLGNLVESDADAVMSLYTFDVYRDRLVVRNHSNWETSDEMTAIPSGSVLKLAEETSEYRRYSSAVTDDSFVIFKAVQSNESGKFRTAFHISGDARYILLSSAEVKDCLEESDDEPLNESGTESPASLPIKFTEHWCLNVDEDNVRLGDTRSEPIRARDACFLVLRVKYSCPDDYVQTVAFDVRITDPDGNIIKLEDTEAKKGYTMVETLETNPGGGIFNVIFGSTQPGDFEKGKYTYEIGNGGQLYYKAVIILQ